MSIEEELQKYATAVQGFIEGKLVWPEQTQNSQRIEDWNSGFEAGYKSAQRKICNDLGIPYPENLIITKPYWEK